MKSSLWLLNSVLILFLTGMLIVLSFSWPKLKQIPQQVPTKSTVKKEVPSKDIVKSQDLQYIFGENDLFKTTKFLPKVEPEVTQQVPPIPRPPVPKRISETPQPAVQFLEPLPIKLTGITSHAIEAKSQANILNVNTRQTKSYRVGDKLFDAYIIRIFPRKIILIRSNGQQEVVYLYEKDAKKEIDDIKQLDWDKIIIRKGENIFEINVKLFNERITSLAQLIEELDATGAFLQGRSIGTRIGKIDEHSLGYALGLMPGDIITNINGIDTTTTNNRVLIYTSIVNNLAKPVDIAFKRNNAELKYNYVLVKQGNYLQQNTQNQNTEKTAISKVVKQEVKTNKSTAPANNRQIQLIQELEKDLETNLEKKHSQYEQSIASRRAKQRDKQQMNNFGRRSSVLSKEEN